MVAPFDPLRATTRTVYVKSQLEDMEQVQFSAAEMQMVTCPRCQYRWRFKGFTQISCSKCGWRSPLSEEYRQLRVSMGLCRNGCNRPIAPTSNSQCQPCLLVNRRTQDSYLHQGKCSCRQPIFKGRFCKLCYTKQKTHVRQYQNDLVAQGKCQSGCGRVLCERSTRFCQVCLDKTVGRAIRNYYKGRKLTRRICLFCQKRRNSITFKDTKTQCNLLCPKCQFFSK